MERARSITVSSIDHMNEKKDFAFGHLWQLSDISNNSWLIKEIINKLSNNQERDCSYIKIQPMIHHDNKDYR